MIKTFSPHYHSCHIQRNLKEAKVVIFLVIHLVVQIIDILQIFLINNQALILRMETLKE